MKAGRGSMRRAAHAPVCLSFFHRQCELTRRGERSSRHARCRHARRQVTSDKWQFEECPPWQRHARVSPSCCWAYWAVRAPRTGSARSYQVSAGTFTRRDGSDFHPVAFVGGLGRPPRLKAAYAPWISIAARLPNPVMFQFRMEFRCPWTLSWLREPSYAYVESNVESQIKVCFRRLRYFVLIFVLEEYSPNL